MFSSSSSSDSKEFDEVAQRIRALTTMLEGLKRQKWPTPTFWWDIPEYLDRLVTLLTCGDDGDVSGSTGSVVTATGSLQLGRMQVLIVAQTASPKSSNSELRVEELYKGEKSFEDVVSGNPDAENLQEHITDMWIALAGYDIDSPTAGDDFTALGSFVVSRCFRKIQRRFNEDRRVFRNGQRLFELIDDWNPVDFRRDHDQDDGDIPVKWLPIPGWLNRMFREPGIEKREVDVGGRSELQWKLASDTVKTWASLLSRLLKASHDAFERASKIRGVGKGRLTRAPSDEERAAMRSVNHVLNALYLFVSWKGGVVGYLIQETSLGDLLLRRMRWIEADDDGSKEWDLRMEQSETGGNRVLRYLSSLTAWHAALDKLCSKPFLRRLDLRVGFLEVPPSDSKVCAEEEFVETYLKCWHRGNEPDHAHAVETIKEWYPEKFMGRIHAEAALMGLLAFVKRGEDDKHGGDVQNEELLHEFLNQAEDAIALANKCCWCCSKLAGIYYKQLGMQFNIPGTHGVILSWSPPTVGIPVEVLRKLENELWEELRSAISEACSSKTRLLQVARASESGGDDGRVGAGARIVEMGAQLFGSF